MDNTIAFLAKAGPLGIVILGCSVAALFIVLERLWAFRGVRRRDRALLARVRERVASGAFSEAARLALQGSDPVTLCVAHVLERAARGECRTREDQERALVHAASKEVRRLEKRLPTLSLIANVSPLLGLLGTVMGMIKAFQAIQNLGGKVNASVLAGGIWEAMLTTALGLGVAIPAMVAHNLFQGRVHEMVADMKEEAQELLDLLPEDRRRAPAEPGVPTVCRPEVAEG